MKTILSIFLLLIASFLVAQPISGIWQGKIYDTNNEPIKFINVAFSSADVTTFATLREFDKATNKWVDINNLKTKFIGTPTGGVLSSVFTKDSVTDSEAFIFSFINSKRIEVEWLSQLTSMKKDPSVITKKGSGFLEPFYNGIVYEHLSIGGTSTNRVSIDKVEIAKVVTIITFSYHNTSFDQVLMRLSKPGEVGAYYITSTDRSKKYHLIDKDNIAFEPNNTLVRPNSFHTFKIYFEPIPESLKSFSILEGDPELQSGKEWNFYDIQLK